MFSRRDGAVTVEAFDTATQPFADGDFGITLMDSEAPDSDDLNIVDGTDGDESLVAGTELNGDEGDDLIRGYAGDDDLYLWPAGGGHP
ncbi:MAG: hypothetical protein U5P41_02050 [Gammaproteobacteria bacterium]|nr:hypothetical protein [Gammaproteobacteria bacterium]